MLSMASLPLVKLMESSEHLRPTLAWLRSLAVHFSHGSLHQPPGAESVEMLRTSLNLSRSQLTSEARGEPKVWKC